MAFSLYQDRLILCHNGKLFTEADIQGICGIRSTKDEPESGKIGRFGIGFKSVYAYTKTSRIYSGQYSFRICNLILPYAEENEVTAGEDTILILPFDGEVKPETAYNEIRDALKKYLSSDVLFALCNVRNISCKIYPDENEWSVSKESTQVDNGVDKVLLTQKPTDSAKKLLVFRTQDKQPILIGYELETDDSGKDRIIPTEQHYLYVFFPTAVETHQKFYIHVPFSTTPARDNVRHNEVNQLLAEKLAALFADSIRWLLKNGYVTLDFLNEVYPILDTCKEENLRGIHEMGLALLSDGLALLLTEEGGYTQTEVEAEPAPDDETLGEYGAVRNLKHREKKLEENFQEGLEGPKTVAPRLRYTCSESNHEEKAFLRAQYFGKCQICGKQIIRYDGKPYFEACNILPTDSIPTAYKQSISEGWNSLCLCPNCAAEFRYGKKNLSELVRMIQTHNVEEEDENLIVCDIEMQGEKRTIKYTGKHFLALQKAIGFYDDYIKKKTGTV